MDCCDTNVSQFYRAELKGPKVMDCGVDSQSMQYSVEELTAHRGRMLLIDRLLQADFQQGITQTMVQKDWPLCDADRVDSVILIELMAQSSGILMGWIKRQQNLEPKPGWLVGIRNANINPQPIPVGSMLSVRVRLEYHVDTYAVFHGWVTQEQQQLAEAVIQVFEPKGEEMP
jgi:predicted hotdog family 3-hydroxylacyl-ACP dehydratase